MTENIWLWLSRLHFLLTLEVHPWYRKDADHSPPCWSTLAWWSWLCCGIFYEYWGYWGGHTWRDRPRSGKVLSSDEHEFGVSSALAGYKRPCRIHISPTWHAPCVCYRHVWWDPSCIWISHRTPGTQFRCWSEISQCGALNLLYFSTISRTLRTKYFPLSSHVHI